MNKSLHAIHNDLGKRHWYTASSVVFRNRELAEFCELSQPRRALRQKLGEVPLAHRKKAETTPRTR